MEEYKPVEIPTFSGGASMEEVRVNIINPIISEVNRASTVISTHHEKLDNISVSRQFESDSIYEQLSQLFQRVQSLEEHLFNNDKQ